ncbi:hypothetical protein C8R46DRAFT_1064202 [Mycena filopes]|nr:hypothetical protein C8R46DRAFT_1064202 [Mycena filopes]
MSQYPRFPKDEDLRRRVLLRQQSLMDFRAASHPLIRGDAPDDMQKQLTKSSYQVSKETLRATTSATEVVDQLRPPHAPGSTHSKLESIDCQRILSGAAAATRAARQAAFHERVDVSLFNSDRNFREVGDLAIDFPPHLVDNLSYVSPRSHGWMFAVDKFLTEAFDPTFRPFKCTLIRKFDDGKKYTVGNYLVIRWFEADMSAAEFLQFSEQDRYLLVSRLTGMPFESSVLDAKERALVLSEHTIPCLFLQHLRSDALIQRPSPSSSNAVVLSSGHFPRSDRAAIPASASLITERVSTTSSSISKNNNNIPPIPSHKMNAPPPSNKLKHEQNSFAVPAPGVKNLSTRDEVKLRSLQQISGPASNVFAPTTTVEQPLIPTMALYQPPPRIAVPALEYALPTPSAPSKWTALGVQPLTAWDSNAPRRDLPQPPPLTHHELASAATPSRSQGTSYQGRNGDCGATISTTSSSFDLHPSQEPPRVHVYYQDQNDPSTPRVNPNPRGQRVALPQSGQWQGRPHTSRGSFPPPNGYYDQEHWYFYGQRG